jgi:hypothetical protein
VVVDRETGEIKLKKLDDPLDPLDPQALSSAIARGSLRISATATERVPGRTNLLSISSTLLLAVVDRDNIAPNANRPIAELPPIREGSTSSSITGGTVKGIFLDSDVFGNEGGNPFAGVALVGNNALQNEGTWQYKSEGTNNWLDVQTITETKPFILLKNDSLRFVPSRIYFGNPGTLKARLLEERPKQWQTGFLPEGDVLAAGGKGSASSQVVDLTTSITAIPKSPISLKLTSASGVPAEASVEPFARASGFDPDTETDKLRYSLIKAEGDTKTELTGNFKLNITKF